MSGAFVFEYARRARVERACRYDNFFLRAHVAYRVIMSAFIDMLIRH